MNLCRIRCRRGAAVSVGPLSRWARRWAKRGPRGHEVHHSTGWGACGLTKVERVHDNVDNLEDDAVREGHVCEAGSGVGLERGIGNGGQQRRQSRRARWRPRHQAEHKTSGGAQGKIPLAVWAERSQSLPRVGVPGRGRKRGGDPSTSIVPLDELNFFPSPAQAHMPTTPHTHEWLGAREEGSRR